MLKQVLSSYGCICSAFILFCCTGTPVPCSLCAALGTVFFLAGSDLYTIQIPAGVGCVKKATTCSRPLFLSQVCRLSVLASTTFTDSHAWKH